MSVLRFSVLIEQLINTEINVSKNEKISKVKDMKENTFVRND